MMGDLADWIRARKLPVLLYSDGTREGLRMRELLEMHGAAFTERRSMPADGARSVAVVDGCFLDAADLEEVFKAGGGV